MLMKASFDYPFLYRILHLNLRGIGLRPWKLIKLHKLIIGGRV